MRKVLRLTETDIRRIVKRVIKEDDEDMIKKSFHFDEDEIQIPDEYDALQSELGGDTIDSGELMNLYNELISDGIYDDIPDEFPPIVSYDGEVFEKGDGDTMTAEEVMMELNDSLMNNEDY